MRGYGLGGLIVAIMLGVGSVYAETPIRILNVDTGTVWVFTSTGVVGEDELHTVTTISAAAVVTPSIGAISVDGKSILAGDYVPQRPEFAVTLTPASGADIGVYSLAIVTVGTGAVIASTANTLGSGVTQAGPANGESILCPG
ncbi:hypothetical protein EBR57_04645 [bacterium]|nr:hypothetical protein [bacterium]